jgi:MFS family permease
MKQRHSFWYLLAGQSLANFADILFVIAAISFVEEKTHSAIITGLIPIVRVTALLVSGMLAPLLLDRFSLRTVLVGSQMGEAAFLFLMSLLFSLFLAGNHFYYLFALMFGLGFFKGWTVPARNSMVPRLVDPQHLLRANGLLSTADQTVQMAAWGVGGVVVALIGWNHTFWLSLGILLISTVSLLLVRGVFMPEQEAAERTSKWDSMKEGWIAIWRTPSLRIVTLMDVVEGIANGVWAAAIIIVYVEEVLHKGTDWFGYVNASYFMGTITGGLLVMALAKFVNRRLMVSMIFGSLGISLLTFGYALTSVPSTALFLCVLMGPAFQLRDIAQRTIFQTHADLSVLPKVYAAQGTIISVTFGVSVFFMGLVTDMFGARTAYLVSAALFAMSALLALTIVKSVKQKETVGI